MVGTWLVWDHHAPPCPASAGVFRQAGQLQAEVAERVGSPFGSPRHRSGASSGPLTCAPGRDRTCDPLLRRQPLCPLSYRRSEHIVPDPGYAPGLPSPQRSGRLPRRPDAARRTSHAFRSPPTPATPACLRRPASFHAPLAFRPGRDTVTCHDAAPHGPIATSLGRRHVRPPPPTTVPGTGWPVAAHVTSSTVPVSGSTPPPGPDRPNAPDWSAK